ncbi:MAG: hypothetical protein IKF64_01310 [Eubacterium sp.]|nr:hypothetical protein [Eubacterium sp.]
MKKTLSLALALVMALTSVFCVSFSAFAAEALVLDTPTTVEITEETKQVDLEFTPEEDGYYTFLAKVVGEEQSWPRVELYAYDAVEEENNYVTDEWNYAGMPSISFGAPLQKDVKYTLCCSSAIETDKYDVTVTKSNVKSIECTLQKDKFEVEEFTNGDLYEDENGEEYFKYYDFELYEVFTDGDTLEVTYNDDSSATYTFYDDEKYGFYNGDDKLEGNIEITSDQRTKHWTVGDDNEFEIFYMGATDTRKVTVTESPVASIAFEPTTISAVLGQDVKKLGEDGYEYSIFDIIRKPGNTITVTFKDKSIKKYVSKLDSYDDYSFLDENGDYYPYGMSISSYNDAASWNAGKAAEFTLETCGKKITFFVKLTTPTPVTPAPTPAATPTPAPEATTPKAADKTTVTLKKVAVKKSAKKLVLQATVKVNGKAVKGKKVTFKFNGKKYTAKTNKKGIAKVTIKKAVLKKLKVGKKIKITATCNKVTAKRTVKVKK